MKNYLKNCKTIKPREPKKMMIPGREQMDRPPDLKNSSTANLWRYTGKLTFNTNNKRTIETSINSYVLNRVLGSAPPPIHKDP